jgi:hypothetical protein
VCFLKQNHEGHIATEMMQTLIIFLKAVCFKLYLAEFLYLSFPPSDELSANFDIFVWGVNKYVCVCVYVYIYIYIYIYDNC